MVATHWLNCAALIGHSQLGLRADNSCLVAAESLGVAGQPSYSLGVLVLLNCVWAVILNPCFSHCFTLVYSHLAGYPDLYFMFCLAPPLRLNINSEVAIVSFDYSHYLTSDL
jgi:hypothetical protein